MWSIILRFIKVSQIKKSLHYKFQKKKTYQTNTSKNLTSQKLHRKFHRTVQKYNMDRESVLKSYLS